MSIRNSIRRLEVTSIGSLPRFLVMFTLVVAGPLVLIVIGVYNPNILGQSNIAWSFLAIALLILICIGGGFLLFRRKSDAGKGFIYQRKGAETNTKGDSK
jgi:hypothetical protein